MVSIIIVKEVDRICIFLLFKCFVKINGNIKVMIIVNIKREVLCCVLNILNFCFLNWIFLIIIDILFVKSRLMRIVLVMEEMMIVFSFLFNVKNEIIIFVVLLNVVLSNFFVVGLIIMLRFLVECLM